MALRRLTEAPRGHSSPLTSQYSSRHPDVLPLSNITRKIPRSNKPA